VSNDQPKFLMGDLVKFDESYVGDIVLGIGIIISEPKLMLIHDWQTNTGFPNEFWSYDVKVGSELFKMVPEQFLEGLKNVED